ncbi:GDP/GTP exchange factor for ARF, partial [Rhizophlyctis rosea]
MSALTHSVTRCKFEATDAVSDEVVLSRILRLLRVTVTSEAGQRNLDDKGICEMVEEHEAILRESLNKHAQKVAADPSQPSSPNKVDHKRRLSASLRLHDEANTIELQHDAAIQSPSIVVDSSSSGQLTHEMGVISVGGDSDESVSAVEDGVRIGYTSNEGIVPETVKSVRHEESKANLEDVTASEGETAVDTAVSGEAPQPAADSTVASTATVPTSRIFHPYGLPAILEMIRVLTTLVDPRNRNHTDSMHRTIALKLLHAAVEVGGRALGRWIGWGIDVQMERKGVKSAGGGQIPVEASEVKIGTNASKSVVSVGTEGGSVHGGVDVKKVDNGRGSGTFSPAPSGADTPIESVASATGKSGIEEEVYDNDEDRMAVTAKNLVLNDLSKYLFQLLQTSNTSLQAPPTATGLMIITLTLRVMTSLLQTAREHMKLHQEWLLTWIMTKANSGVAVWDIEEWHQGPGEDVRPALTQQQKGGIVVGEVRELLLECLAQLCRVPTFTANLYVNYDGDQECQSHLFEEFMQFAAKHSFPDATPGGPVTTITHQTLCLDMLLMYLNAIVDRKSALKGVARYDAPPTPRSITQSAEGGTDVELPNPATLSDNKQRKRVLKEGADRFNEKPKEGIKFLQAQGFLPDPVDPVSLATLLKSTSNFNKTLLGDYLSKPDNIELLKAFVKLMDFAGGKRIDEALRLLLESFRLPGESQQIARIMEVFAETYFAVISQEEGHELADQDAAYILSYSVIMLNTDQHNPQVRRRMTLEDFTRNNRGMNGGKDFSPEYIKQIYHEIKHNEIVMPEEHEGDLGFNYQWKELMKRAENAGPLLECRTSAYDKDMFLLSWSSIIAAVTYAFDNAEDDLTLQKAVVGIHQMGAIAAHYKLVDVLDTVVVSLSRMTGLLREGGREREPLVDENGNRIGVDQWVVEFGRNWRGQVAAVLMFGMVREWGGVVRTGWVHVMESIRNLFMHSFLPPSMLEAEDFVRHTISIPKIPTRAATKMVSGAAARREAGLFSTLSHFLSLSSPNSVDEFANAEPTEEEVQAESVAAECLRACRVEELERDSRFLETEALRHLLKTTLQASFDFDPPKETGSEGVAVETLARPSTPTNQQSLTRPPVTLKPPSPLPEESTPTSTIHGTSPRTAVSFVWDIWIEHVREILKAAGAVQVLLIERAVVSLLRVCTRLVHKDDLSSQIFEALDLLVNLPADIFNLIAERAMAGVVALIKVDSALFVNYCKWDTIVELLTSSAMHPQAARYGFEATGILVTESRESVVTAENFGECVDLLIGYSVGAGAGSGVEAVSPGGSPKVGRRVTVKTKPAQANTDRALKALEHLYRLHLKIPILIKEGGIKPNRAFFEFWLPILSGLSQQSYHPAREVRQSALTLLQRALLSPELEASSSSPDTWTDVFDNVLFPLLDELLKPDVGKLDPLGMDETRMRATGLLCQIFLQYLPRLVRAGQGAVVD